MKTLTDSKALTVFALGLVLGLSIVAGVIAPRAHADFGTDIVCYVFNNLDNIGTPLPPLSDGSCPSGSSSSQVGDITVTASVTGGAKNANDFTLYLNGVAVTSGVATTTATGFYTVTTSSDPNYNVVFGGDCSASGHVTSTAGSHKSCTVSFVCNVPTGGDTGGNGGGPGGAHATSSDLSITKIASTQTPAPGQNVTFTLVAHNNGPDAADHVSVTDQLPATLTYVSDSGNGSFSTTTGIWTVGAVATTSDTMLTIVAQVGTSTDTITNTASISGSNSTDPNSTNNTSSVILTPIVPTAGGNGNGGGGGTTGGGGGTGNTGGVVTSSSGGGSSGSGGATGGGSGSVSPTYGSGGGFGGIVLGTTTEATCGEYLQQYLRQGRKNDSAQVVKLQSFLNSNMHSALPTTGFFGPRTFAAVNSFQLTESASVLAPWVPYGLPNAHTPTGYVYKTTRHRINEIMCPTLNAPMPILP